MMTDEQRLLMPYVEKRAIGIMAGKRADGVRPVLATEPEIAYSLREDVMECMRELCRRGVCRGVNTLNAPALMSDE